MKSPLIPLLLGCAFVAGAVGIHRQQLALQRADVRDIAGLRTELDSVRAALARAPAGPDSVRFARSVEERTYILGRREFHVPSRQDSIDRWWTLTGPGSLLTAVGALLIVLATITWRRARMAAALTPPPKLSGHRTT